MYIWEDGMKLNAQLDLPAESAMQCPLVIVLHGFTGHMDERHIEAVSKAMNEVGYATLRVELYGHGKSDGQFKDHTIYKWITNVMTVIDYAKTLPFVTDIYLAGHSQGGLTTMLVGALEKDVLKGLIELSPACCIPDDAKSGNTLGCIYDPGNIPDEVGNEGGWSLRGNYFRVAQAIDYNAAIDAYKGPVLIVHGDADETVNVKYAIEADKRYENSALVLVHDDTHCFDRHLEEMTAAVASWLKERK